MSIQNYINLKSTYTGETYKIYIPIFKQTGYVSYASPVALSDIEPYALTCLDDFTGITYFWDSTNSALDATYIRATFPNLIELLNILPYYNTTDKLIFDNGNYLKRRSSNYSAFDCYDSSGNVLYGNIGSIELGQNLECLTGYDPSTKQYINGGSYSGAIIPAVWVNMYHDKFNIANLFKYKNNSGCKIITTILNGVEPTTIDTDNPYSNGGTSKPGGGNGSYNGTSDTVPVPNLPTLSALNTGFFSMYSPSLSQLNSLASWLWSTDPVTNLTKLFGEPLKSIIGLSLVPVNPTKGSSQTVKLGNLDSGVSMPVLSSQYVQVNCGEVSLSEYYGAAMDYAPYTQAQLYVPYCGIYNIDIDDVMDGTSSLVYNIDLLSGACSAMLTCSKGNLNSVLYNFTGNVNTNIPVTSQDWAQLIRSVISAAGAVGMAIANEGAAGAVAGAVAAGSAGAAIGSANNILGSAKPTISRGGCLSTAMGALSVQVPYFIISRPIQSIPESYQHYSGLPANITAALSGISGFTVMESIFIDLPNATDNEKTEIETLLKGGVIL